MIKTLVIFCFWFFGGVVGNAWMTRMIAGFPSRKAVEVLSLAWGLVIAVCARLIIVSLILGTAATVITYAVGAVVSGPTRSQQNDPRSEPLHQMRLTLDYLYYKKEVLSSIPFVTYIVASLILFFVWG